MPRYRVKAFFMHEHEESAAHDAVNSSVISSAEWTPGYVMGVLSADDIESLTKQGLIVTVVEEVGSVPEAVTAGAAPPRRAIKKAGRKRAQKKRAARPQSAGAPGAPLLQPGVYAVNQALALGVPLQAPRPVAKTADRRSSSDKILSSDRNRAEFYVVRFHGPLTKERSDALARKKIKLLERLTRNKYTARLEPSAIDTLAQLDFVDTIRRYTVADTLKTVEGAARKKSARRKRGAKKKTAALSAKPARRMRLYVVRLHRAKDLPTVVDWLKQRKRAPLWKNRNLLRVALIDGGRDLKQLADLPEVAEIDPVEMNRLFDEFARALLGLPSVNGAPLGLRGAGEIIGIADTGLDVTHLDFQGRIAGTSAWGRRNDVSDPDGHGTHVAGCALGDGAASNGDVVGAAPGAKLFLQSILDKNGRLGGLPADLTKLFKEAYDAGARIHNNSWGAFTFAHYTSTSLDVDRFVAEHPDMLIVIAAGNDGIGVPRAAGFKMNAAGGFVDWPCVAAPATSKNGLTVGASRSSRTKGGFATLTWGDVWADRYPQKPISAEKISGQHECLAAFSSRGPSDDLRIKPDVVAPGTDIAAAKSKDAPLRKFWGAYPNNDKYGFMGGTSMAAPYVAGCAALVREYFRTKANWATPSAALIKAVLVNGARRMNGNDSIAMLTGDPNFHQGFGRIDMAATLPNAAAAKLELAFSDDWLDSAKALDQTGARRRFQVEVGAALPLRICLAWTDPPARGLQNTLVLLADDGAQGKWIGNSQAASLLQVAGTLQDPNNNVQVIRVTPPIAGTYTIAVTASNLLLPPQTFALVVTGALESPLQEI